MLAPVEAEWAIGSVVNSAEHGVARCQKFSWKQVPTCRPVKAIDLSRVEGSRNYDYHQCKTKCALFSQVTLEVTWENRSARLAVLAQMLQKSPKTHKIENHLCKSPVPCVYVFAMPLFNFFFTFCWPLTLFLRWKQQFCTSMLLFVHESCRNRAISHTPGTETGCPPIWAARWCGY